MKFWSRTPPRSPRGILLQRSQEQNQRVQEGFHPASVAARGASVNKCTAAVLPPAQSRKHSRNSTMGAIQSIFNTLFKLKRDVRILMVGLDAAGKTTILYKLKLGENINTIPTIGFNVEQVVYKNLSFTMWDVGGQDKIRALWRHYYSGCEGIIYVVDSLDRDRMALTRDTLKHMLGDDELRNAHVLVLANKQDMPGAMTAAEIGDKMELSSLRGRNWHCQPCCAVSGEGLYEGLDWMCAQMAKSR